MHIFFYFTYSAPPGSNSYSPYGNRPYSQPNVPNVGSQNNSQPPQGSGTSTPPATGPPTGPPGQQSPYPPGDYNYRPNDVS